MFFDSKLETKGGKPSLKQKSVAKLLELKEEYDLCDIWRIRNPTKKLYTFRQNHSSGIINRRLDYIFISNKLQEFSNDTKIIPAFKSIILVSVTIFNYNFFKAGPGLWKFNNSLINDETFTNTLKNFIQNMINELNTNTFLDNQLKWELLKYEIRRFTISYCKQRNKKDVAERKYLENKFKNLENVLDNYDNLESYHNIKKKIEEIYEKKAEGARIRSKCLWYEEGEKSSKFYLNLKKRRSIQGQIRKLIVNNQEIGTRFRMNSCFSMKLFLKIRHQTLLKTAKVS